jgi:hypothetical protein
MAGMGGFSGGSGAVEDVGVGLSMLAMGETSLGCLISEQTIVDVPPESASPARF